MSDANITWLTDTIATGGDFSFHPDKASRQMQHLLGMEIDLVIDCRLEWDDEDLWAQTEVNYLYLPTDDRSGHHIPAEHFDNAVAAATPYLLGGGKVFAHCHMGVNRGPSTAFALLLETGMTPEDAFDLIREKRPQAAVYYAMDALVPHLKRNMTKVDVAAETVARFEDHMKTVFTKEQRRKVQHGIRDHHRQDRIERMG